MHERPDTETTFDIVCRALAPYLGANMARSVTRGHCDKLGISPRSPSLDEIARLTDALRPGLNVFVGRSTTEVVIDQIREELERTARTVEIPAAILSMRSSGRPPGRGGAHD